ncbi:hypothetical protein [Actinomadura hibisca]|uniref:hypothetical protein n=1 Tax=Actinomadura hibisca TaxID=68565 RepID=UPI000830F486|nr:hypothetical protein [Actinomadura hibisca]
MKDEQRPGGWDDLRIDGTPGDSAALSRLLDAAAAPGVPAELAGEEAALAAFRAAAPAPVEDLAQETPAQEVPLPDDAHEHGLGRHGRERRGREQRGREQRGRGLGRPLGRRAVKVAVAVCALLSAGGVAVAAGTGTLPGAHPPQPPATRSPAPAQHSDRLVPGPGQGGVPSGRRPSTGPTSTGEPTPTPTPGVAKGRDKKQKRGHQGKNRGRSHQKKKKKAKRADKPSRTSRPEPGNGRGPRPRDPRPPRWNGASPAAP